MATSYTREVRYFFPAGSFNIPNANGIQSYRLQKGWKRSKGDKRGTPYSYVGFTDVGRVLRPGDIPTATYGPDGHDGARWIRSSVWEEGLDSRYFRNGVNRSWGKLMDDIKGPNSSLGATAAEGREAFEMVATRAAGLYKAYKSLRKGNFKQFLNELSVNPKRKHRSKTRSTAQEASGLWLEYWFGWSPTVQDIYDSVDVLTSAPILGKSKCVGVARLDDDTVTRVIDTGGDFRRVMTDSISGFAKQGCFVEIENYNLFLLNRLGLVNPAAIAWELVPFSFVVDWFVKLGDCISSYTDLVGVRVTDPYTTAYAKIKSEGSYGRSGQIGAAWNTYVHYRTTYLTRPVPIAPRISNFGTSITRAATAVSLLNTIFLHGRK